MLGLGVDESYEVVVSRLLSWGYLDHPPLSFWMARVVADLAHSENRVLLRLPFILTFAGTTWLMFRLGARLFGQRAGMYAALLLNLAPVFSLSTGGWILPDGPLDFAMVAAALLLVPVLVENDEAHAWKWWLAAGVMTGVAMLSKYHSAFLLLGTVAFVVTRPEARKWLARPHAYVAVLVAFFIFHPVVLWNAEHAFVSFRFQGGRAVPTHGHHLQSLMQNLAGQAGYLLPWIWVPLVWQLYRALRAGPGDAKRWLLVCLGAGPVLVFTLVSLGGNPGLPHWPAPGYLLLLPLVGDAAARFESRGSAQAGRLHRWLVAAGVAFVGLTA
ncbi:MAG: glycosyltransferase family 39 protein, partial [Gemmatimonadota bacterium]|nr:glycosyltransferase family 39 protein [Gemmatimonadota bacterium]